MDFSLVQRSADIKELTMSNEWYRLIIDTVEDEMQLTVMSIKPNENIPRERHDFVQFIRVEQGMGSVLFDDGQISDLETDSAVIIPPNTYHRVENDGNVPLKLYSIYTGVAHSTDPRFKIKARQRLDVPTRPLPPTPNRPPFEQEKPPAAAEPHGKDVIQELVRGVDPSFIRVPENFERQKGRYFVKSVSGHKGQKLELYYYVSREAQKDDVIARIFAPVKFGRETFQWAGQALIKKTQIEKVAWIERAVIFKDFRGRRLCASLIFYTVDYFLRRMSRGRKRKAAIVEKGEDEIEEYEEEEEEEEEGGAIAQKESVALEARDELIIAQNVPQFHVWIFSEHPEAARACYTRAVKMNGYELLDYRGGASATFDYYSNVTNKVETVSLKEYDSGKHGLWSEVLVFVRVDVMQETQVRNSGAVSEEKKRLMELKRVDKSYEMPEWTNKILIAFL